MKKVCSLVSLLIMVFSNTITPFAYAVGENGGDSSSAGSEAVSSVSDAGGSSETSSTSSDAGSEASSESASDSASESSAEAASSSENTDAAETASSDEVVAEEITADESENLVEDAEVIVSDATEVSEDDESFEESDESVVEGSSDEVSETEVIDLSDKKYSSKSAAQLTNLLGGDWEKDKYSFAENLGIQDYYGKPEQNEIIRQWILSHNALPSENVTHEASEAQGVSDEEDEGSDDEDDQSVVEEMEMLDLEALKEALDDEASLSEELVDEEDASLLEKISEEVKDIINSIRYFFKKDTGSEFIRYGSDGNGNGTIMLIDPENSSSIVIMDKNLGAKSTKDNGNYFQWGNNVGVEEVNAGNTTSAKAIYEDKYNGVGFDGEGFFRIGESDYWEDNAHYNNLWGDDSYDELSRAGACPAGYHIPTEREWYSLLTLWGRIHTQKTTINEEDGSVSNSIEYKENNGSVSSFKEQAVECSEDEEENCIEENNFDDVLNLFVDELRLPLAGSYDQGGNYTENLGIYWTSNAGIGGQAKVFSINNYFAGSAAEGLLSARAEGHSVRCFKNVSSVSVVKAEEEKVEEKVEVNSGNVVELTGEASETLEEDGAVDELVGETDEDASEKVEASVEEVATEEAVSESASTSSSFVENVRTSIETIKNFFFNKNEDGSLKGEELIGSVNVSIDAEEGAFPENTTISIKEVSEVQYADALEKLSDVGVSEDATVLAFDISFLDEDGGEIQPAEGKKVSVKFDYTKNDELLEANKEDLQVFHMNEETQEAEEVAIESVANGEIEIIAESFSVYTIVINEGDETSITISYDTNGGHFQDKLVKKDVVYTADEDGVFRAATDWKTPSREGYMFAGWYLEANGTTAWTGGVAANMTVYAKWLPFEDLTFTSGGTTIVMMDRNLGATASGTGSDAYGYYYQWGNNYGFTLQNAIVTGEIETTWTNTPSTYYSNLWRYQEGDGVASNLWGEESNLKSDKQGPCPEGYYVPTSGDWQDVVDMFGSVSGDVLRDKLKLPIAGILIRETGNKTDFHYNLQEKNGRYWSSGLANIKNASILDFGTGYIKEDTGIYVRGNSVRCFKDVDYDGYNITGDDVSRNNFGYDTIEIGDYLVMDRNLGAKAAWDKTWNTSYETELDSYGYYYQRGNNYGFSSITTEAGADSAVTVDDEYIPSGYASGVWNSAPAWSTQSNLWGDVTNTTVARQGPCPSGWYVPSMSDWENIYSAWQEENQGSTTKDFAEYLLLAPNGYRSNTLAYNNTRGTVGYYLSSDSYDDNNSKYLKIETSTITTGAYMYRSNGGAVRCIQYNPDHTVTFDANRGAIVDAQTVAHGGTATEPETSFPGYTFTGWYLEGEDIPFDFSTPITEDITLVARWTYNNVIQDLDIYMLGTDENSLGHVSMMDRNLGASSGYNIIRIEISLTNRHFDTTFNGECSSPFGFLGKVLLSPLQQGYYITTVI